MMLKYARTCAVRGAVLVWVLLWALTGSAQPLKGGLALHPEDRAADLDRGKGLAEYYCALCHQYPAPDLLDRETWLRQTLPRMKIRVGLAPEYVAIHPEAKYIKATGVIPTEPMMSEEEFMTIVRYYVATAPPAPLPQGPRPEITKHLAQFAVDRKSYRRADPSTTLVKINPDLGVIYVGHAKQQVVDIFDLDLNLRHSIPVDNIPISVDDVAGVTYICSIGSFLPSDIPKGEIAAFRRRPDSYRRLGTVLKGIPRPSGARFADINEDGLLDFVVSKFGNLVGGVSWYENLGHGKLKEHPLIQHPGGLPPVVGDFNGDGHPDIAILVAQAWEMMFIMTNDGHGDFDVDVAFKHHPLFGHSSFEMVDFNRDGLVDIVATNGDNGEYPSPTKRYHGVRVYLNQGANHFKEAYFYPLNGAYKAIARDFDQDGDTDIAVISFFPDYRRSPEESFVYLEDHGGLDFTASTFRGSLAGRWLTMDSGDLDGDGDLDLVLGSFIHGPSPVPEALLEKWEAKGPSVLILRNTLKTP